MITNNETSIILMTKAEQMLAKATTIQKAKELKDLALTAKQWATRKGLGKKIIQHCELYAIEAEIRMGELLSVTQRAIGTKGQFKGKDSSGGHILLPPEEKEPTLIALRISKNESAQAQKLAKAPENIKEKLRAGKIKRSQAMREIRNEKEKVELAEAQKKITETKRKSIENVCDLRICSCIELFNSGIKPDAVITDPPYAQEFLPVFSELAKSCSGIKVPLVAVMSGQSYLPEVLKRLCKYLTYRWTLAYLTPGGQAVQQWKAKINAAWKPVFLFGEPQEWLGDVASSKPNDNDKRFHGWGQSESGMADLIERLTKPGQLICDPFLGGGTTAIVSLSLGRRFVGCDLDSECVKTARQRIEVMFCQK